MLPRLAVFRRAPDALGSRHPDGGDAVWNFGFSASSFGLRSMWRCSPEQRSEELQPASVKPVTVEAHRTPAPPLPSQHYASQLPALTPPAPTSARSVMKPEKPNRTLRLPRDYAIWLTALKARVRSAQLIAAARVNHELLRLYWDLGRAIAERQKQAGWGAAIIPRLAADLHDEFPEMTGFSERNMKRMLAFHREYPELFAKVPQAAALFAGAESSATIVPPAVAQLDSSVAPSSISQQLAAKLPWAHHLVLLEKVKDRAARAWYMQAAVENGWSRSVLAVQIAQHAHRRAGKAVTNFAATLPPPQSDLAQQPLRDRDHRSAA